MISFSRSRVGTRASLVIAYLVFIFGGLQAQDNPRQSAPDGAKAKPLPKRTVIIVRDGPSWYFDDFVKRTKRELTALAEKTYDLTIEEIDGKNDAGTIQTALRDSLDQENVDLILAAGYSSTNFALQLTADERKRPVLGGAVQFSNILDDAISAEGTSKIPNYTFITNPQRLSADFEAFKQLSGQRAIYATVDQRIMEDVGPDEILQVRKGLEKRYGVDIRMVGVGNSVEGILNAIPIRAKAVYVSILPGLPPTERKKLFEAMSKRGVLSFSMVGVSDVRLGAIAGQAPENADAVAKRAALNSHQILLGINPKTLPVYLPVEDRLTINVASGKLAGWYPDYETVLTATILNGGIRETGERLTLEKAMKLARDENAEVRIQLEQEIIARSDFRQAKSFQRPSVNLNIQQNYINYSDRINPVQTPDRLSAGSYGMELRQSLFNDSIRSNIGTAKENIAAEHLNSRSEQLDAMEEAGVAFLNYLSANSLWNIQRENLRLTENNLQLAKLRVNIGAVDQSETYRWEQDAASSRATVFQFEADRDNARIELNRILGQARDRNWRFEDIELSNEDTYFMGNVLTRHLKTQNDVDRYGTFLMKIAVPASPELAAFDYGLSAQGIQLARVERSFFLPEVTAILGLTRTGQGTEKFNYTTQGETSAGVALSFPLYEGGLRKAEFSGQKAVVRQLQAQRERSLQLIEQRALVSMNDITSQHPNIRLSRRGLEAAEKNYDAVRDKYSQGASTILDLLDAQSALLGQRQQAALAVYSYLSGVVKMQRSVAWFEFEKSSKEKIQWEKMLGAYMNRGVLEIPAVARPEAQPEETRQKAEDAVAAAHSAETKPTLWKSKKVPTATAKPIKVHPIGEASEAGEKKIGLLQRIFQKKRE